MKLDPHDSTYPSSLCRRLDEPPTLTVSGPLDPKRRAVAIVGSREPVPGARKLAFSLAYRLARADVIVVSGGATGVDEMAHRGAMQAGGATWCVACTGRGAVFPPAHDVLFDAIESSPASRMIWPFADRTPKDETTPRFRNSVLVGLAECVVVVQAGLRSGSRNAATWGHRLGVPVYIVPGSPWDEAFEGSTLEIMKGARPLWSQPWLFDKLGLPGPDMADPRAELDGKLPPKGSVPRPARRRRTIGDLPLFPVDPGVWSEDERRVFSRLSLAPMQQDAVIASVGLATASTLTALLTLSLKDVVVEGPDGFFRRSIAL